MEYREFLSSNRHSSVVKGKTNEDSVDFQGKISTFVNLFFTAAHKNSRLTSKTGSFDDNFTGD